MFWVYKQNKKKSEKINKKKREKRTKKLQIKKKYLKKEIHVFPPIDGFY